MSQQGANRYPVVGKPVLVDQADRAHGGRKGRLVYVDDDFGVVAFDGGSTGIIDLDYLTVLKQPLIDCNIDYFEHGVRAFLGGER